jgi:hypothetical protein
MNPSESTSQTSGVKQRKQWDNNTTYSNSTQVNRLFTKQQNWEINMNNKIVKKKIDAAMTKPRRPRSSFKTPTGKSSTAINQARQAKDILNANQKMAARLKNVKSTINK